MELSTIFTVIGLSLDIVGVIVLFFNGPPVSPILPDGSELIWESSTPEKKALATKKIRISKCALVVIILGFVLQLFGALC